MKNGLMTDHVMSKQLIVMYPKRNAFEMAAHDAQFETKETLGDVMATIDSQVKELESLIGKI